MMCHGAQRAKVLGCHCDRCREDVARRNRADRESRRLRLLADPTLAVHGRASTYTNWVCRCVPCIEAKARDWARYAGRAA